MKFKTWATLGVAWVTMGIHLEAESFNVMRHGKGCIVNSTLTFDNKGHVLYRTGPQPWAASVLMGDRMSRHVLAGG